MAYYVRKFARAKWSLLERETEDIIDNYKADTIANDMRTMGNTLSLWKVDSLSDADIEPVIVINSLLGDTISKLELMFIPEQFIENYTLEQDDGNTVVTNYCKHRLTRAHREKQLKMSCQALHNAPPNRT